jgi:hypothetical protein
VPPATRFAATAIPMLSAAASSAAAAPATDYTYPGPVFRTEQLEIGQFVGKGSFGDVHFAKLTTDRRRRCREECGCQAIHSGRGRASESFPLQIHEGIRQCPSTCASLTGAPALPSL